MARSTGSQIASLERSPAHAKQHRVMGNEVMTGSPWQLEAGNTGVPSLIA
jgi:hypothetical protein